MTTFSYFFQKCHGFAGTYINLQDAYAVEALNIGTWQQVGYTGAGSNSSGGSESAVFLYLESASAPQWTVKTKNKLNDCPANQASAWTLAAYNASDAAAGQGSVLYKTGGVDACTGLTPSYGNLVSGRSTSGS